MVDRTLPDETTISARLDRTGISARLGRLFAIQIAVISLTIVAGVFAIAFIVTDVLSREALEGEAEYYWSRYATSADVTLPDTDNMVGYMAGHNETSSLPQVLRDKQPGFGRVRFEDKESLLHVSDGPAGRLYLIFRQEQVSRLTLYFGVIPGVLVLLLIYGMSYFSYRLSQQAVSPLIRLSKRLEAYKPLLHVDGQLSLDDLRGDADVETATMIDALDRFAQRLEAFAKRERDFARDASHELRTPLAVLGASLDLLDRNGDRPERERACLLRMRRAVMHMQALTESLLLLAREDDIPVQAGGADVNGLIHEQIELLHDRALETGNTVRLEPLAQVHIDAPDRLVGIAFSNLLTNSLNYTRNGTISVVVGPDFLTVRDSGVGMNSEEVRRAFEPFFRGGAAARDLASGHGLGLAIVQRIARRLHWGIDIESEPGTGTTITLRFKQLDQSGATSRKPLPGMVSISS